MTDESRHQKLLIRWWLVFFAFHLLFLLLAVWSIYFARRFATDALKIFVTNDFVFNLSIAAGVILLGISFFFRQNIKGFIWSLIVCLLISMIGLIVLFSIDSFYFLLWFILGLSGMGIHLYRCQNYWEKLRNEKF